MVTTDIVSLVVSADSIARIDICACFHVPNTAAQSAVSCSPGLSEWLVAHKTALCFSACDVGSLFLLGIGNDQKIKIYQYGIDHSTGIALRGHHLLVGSRRRIIRFERTMLPSGGHAFRPAQTYQVGDLDIHEVSIGEDGRVRAVATSESVVVTLGRDGKPNARWQPSFITSTAAEDRCHLNGFYVEAGSLKYVTAFCQGDTQQAWRDLPHDRGVVISAEKGDVVINGLSRPHSPRLHEGTLYVLESGRGTLTAAQPDGSSRRSVALLPGFARGLDFHAGHAAVTTSLPRYGRQYELPLDHLYTERGSEPMAGVQIVDMATGEIVHWIRFRTGLREMFDVKFLPNVTDVGFRVGTIED